MRQREYNLIGSPNYTEDLIVSHDLAVHCWICTRIPWGIHTSTLERVTLSPETPGTLFTKHPYNSRTIVYGTVSPTDVLWMRSLQCNSSLNVGWQFCRKTPKGQVHNFQHLHTSTGKSKMAFSWYILGQQSNFLATDRLILTKLSPLIENLLGHQILWNLIWQLFSW